MNYNDKLYDMWMDCARLRAEWIMMPCGHTVLRHNLSLAGGICPVCEMDKDQKELGDWPETPEVK